MAIQPQIDQDNFAKRPVETTIKIGMTLLLCLWCFYIVQPFIVPLVWSLIITVSIFPVYKRLLILLNGRQKLAASIVTLVLLLIIVVPVVTLAGAIANSGEGFAQQLAGGTFSIPLPTEKVASWPSHGGIKACCSPDQSIRSVANQHRCFTDSCNLAISIGYYRKWSLDGEC
jgi:predicted PurR-regulated permease PerM